MLYKHYNQHFQYISFSVHSLTHERSYFQRRIYNVNKTDIVEYFTNKYTGYCICVAKYACL